MTHLFIANCRQRIRFVLGVSVLIGATLTIYPSSVQGNDDLDMRRAYMDTQHGQLHYWTAGKGPPLILVHQTLKTSDEFLALAPYLADHFQLIAIDLPGHGGSDDPPGPHTMENLTRAVIDVANHLNLKKFSALGHHGGALVVSSLGATVPERIHKLILSGTSGPSEIEVTEQEKAQRLQLTKRKFAPDESGEEILKIWRNIVRQRSTGATIRDVVAPFIDSIETRMRPYEILSVYFTWDREPAQRSLRMPVLLIQGELDAAVQNQERLLDRIPNVRRVLLPNCGVFAFYDCAQESANPIKDFLS